MSSKKEGETMERSAKKKKGLGALILVLVCLVAVVGVGIVLFGKGTSTPIDPKEYLTVEFQGYIILRMMYQICVWVHPTKGM